MTTSMLTPSNRVDESPEDEDSETGVTFSVVAPAYNEAESLPAFYGVVSAVLASLGEPYELVLVDDGSTDATPVLLRQIAERDTAVRVVRLSRNFGHQTALSAGLDAARGWAVITIDADLQDPPEVIPLLVERWRAGGEVVYAQRIRRRGETAFKRATAALFYRLIERIADVDIPRDTGDLRLLDRRAVDALVDCREQHRFLRGLSAWVGFTQVAVPYERAERYADKTKYPLAKMLRFALDAITGFSTLPLRVAPVAGSLLVLLSLAGIVLVNMQRIFNGASQGQSITPMLVLFLGGIQLIFLGVLGEYVGRIYDEVRSRPLYIVSETIARGTSSRADVETPSARRAPPQRSRKSPSRSHTRVAEDTDRLARGTGTADTEASRVLR